jgi:hypothetical protein
MFYKVGNIVENVKGSDVQAESFIRLLSARTGVSE